MTIPPAQVRNPSLTLYAFHLRNDITKGPTEVEADAVHLWKKFVQLADPLQAPELASLAVKLICYQNDKYDPVAEDQHLGNDVRLLRPGYGNTFSSLGHDFDLQVLIDPYRINDTYAADLTVFSSQVLPVTKLGNFNPDGCLLPHQIGASLGQTLLFYAEPVEKLESYQALATECIQQFIPNNPPQLMAEGSLCQNPIFEFDTVKNDLGFSCHVWVWFNTNQSTQMIQVSGTLLNLLCCRHKILYLYQQSRHSNQEARQLYKQIEQYVSKTQGLQSQPAEQRLQQLKQWRVELPRLELQFAQSWRDLEDHQTAIAINADNYQQLLAKLEDCGPDLEFLRQFLSLTEHKYQRQIEADMRFLAPGLPLLTQLIDTLRDLVEIEQAESDRRLQEILKDSEAKEKERDRLRDLKEKESDLVLQLTIGAVGFGLAVSGITSQVEPAPLQAICSQFSALQPTCTYLSIEVTQAENGEGSIFTSIGNAFVHTGLGLLLGIIMYLLLRWFFRDQLKNSDKV